MNKIEDLIKLEDILINKPAKIYVTFESLDKANVVIEGNCSDVLVASFDLIVALIEKDTNVDSSIFISTILDRGNKFRILQKKRLAKNEVDFNISDCYLHFDVDENSYIKFDSCTSTYTSIFGIVSMLDCLVEKYNLDYDSYVEFFTYSYRKWLSGEKRKEFLSGKYDKK